MMGKNRSPVNLQLAVLGVLVLVTTFLAGCASLSTSGSFSVKPVQKIGLIAPFEGLYRRTGYEALDAVRQAIDDADVGNIGLLPLALDDSADPNRARRAAEKVVASADVGAVIGPLAPQRAAVVTSVMETLAPSTLWIVPYAVDPPGGFAQPSSAAWANDLVAAIAAAARHQGAQRMVLAGWHVGWPAQSDEVWSQIAAMPVLVDSTPTAVSPTDAVFWLGAADTGAAYLHALRSLNLMPPFWLGAAGGDPVFVERAPDTKNVYWATWSRADYQVWADGRSPATPSAFLIYNATLVAIAHITDRALLLKQPWSVAMFAFDGADRSIPFSFQS